VAKFIIVYYKYVEFSEYLIYVIIKLFTGGIMFIHLYRKGLFQALFVFILLLIFGFVVSCNTTEDTAVTKREAPASVSPLFKPMPAKAQEPADNIGTKEKIELGHMLYFEPKLSRSEIISCNTCHVVGAAGVDHRTKAIGEGARTGPRNSPTVYNAAFLESQFWDGRAPTLEEQAKGPIQAHVEMDLTPEEAITRLKNTGYEPYFKKAFPDEENPLTFDNLAKALAAFERTLITPGSPFDRYLEGDYMAITEKQKAGLKLFQEKGCISCHHGPLLGGNGFQKFSHVAGSEDVGRQSVTNKENDKYVFRVAPLRNISLTHPYFHDGSAKTLKEAVTIMGKSQLGKEFTPEEIDKLVAFLESLTGEFPMVQYPALPRMKNQMSD
jgi:cytochrome c peroxidase